MARGSPGTGEHHVKLFALFLLPLALMADPSMWPLVLLGIRGKQ